MGTSDLDTGATSGKDDPSRQVFMLVNAGSGGGDKQQEIVAAALDLGIHHQIAAPGDDFEPILAAALAQGANLLAAAGGDGTLCTVAEFAMAHDVPMIVVPAGTRNHFALDLGLDIGDPATVLRQSLAGMHERRVDVGSVNGHPFLNNVSLGLYATAESRADYRQHKVGAFVAAAREALSADDGGRATLSLAVPGSSITDAGDGTTSVMVVNNAYSPGFAPGKRLRARLDAGEVWVYVGGGLDLDGSGMVALVHDVESLARNSPLRAAFGATHVSIGSDRPAVPIAVDGEHRPDLQSPFDIASRQGALRLIVPAPSGSETVEVVLSW